MIKVDIKEIKVNADFGSENIKKGIANGLMAIALMAQGEAQKSILKGPKTGKLYKRGKKTHQASAPGEAPANDYGFLANKINADIDFENMVANLHSSAPYSASLEYGTRHMAARPFLRPAVDRIKPQAEGILVAYIKAAE